MQGRAAVKLMEVHRFRTHDLVGLFAEASKMPSLKPPQPMLEGINDIGQFLTADPRADFSILSDVTSGQLSFKSFSIEQFVDPACRDQLLWLVNEKAHMAIWAAWAEELQIFCIVITNTH
ncbi:hypothetical protein TSOC_013672 [Tetrabaena socialis]|uniref:Uncharacterized protein n=1 Tax=Tetrabaena socialis TaxID=47790 RepID=A0A2J7ZJQ9_9CHLO|nr:hypothetical protein TSOC_013672 [Tetrabaena socialis]|eukprot:PNH00499.1 hypothetical protein TSOC_013672 [Tetrabaena socialis]